MARRLWTEPMIAQLCGFLADGLTFSQIAARLNCSRSRVSGAVFRHILNRDTHAPIASRPTSWETRLTEPYAVRKARRLNAKTPTNGGAEGL